MGAAPGADSRPGSDGRPLATAEAARPPLLKRPSSAKAPPAHRARTATLGEPAISSAGGSATAQFTDGEIAEFRALYFQKDDEGAFVHDRASIMKAMGKRWRGHLKKEKE